MNFSEIIIDWYNKNKRNLPWRNTSDPYKIWLSEIILQQTRVEQGKPYYFTFIENFPTVKDLAKAHQDDVLKLWQGLGYYSRARNLHFAAQQVVNEFDGVFPDNYKDLLKLKGVGDYTAAAIASFAFDEAKAVVDGNVYRVLSRVFGIASPIDSSKGKKEFQNIADELIDRNQPAAFNQAIMEFGALQCVPASPDCENCPLKIECEAYKKNIISQLPFKEKKIKQKHRYFNYFIITDKNDNIAIQQRGKGDIWENLFELPLIETSSELNENFKEIKKLLAETFKSNSKTSFLFNQKHILTHRIINAKFFKIEVEKLDNPSLKWKVIPLTEAKKFAFPRLIDLAFEKLNLY